MPPLPDTLSVSDSAVFLDFDGTLVAFAEHPDGVHVSIELMRVLGKLQTRTGGALAVVTGRDIATVDRFLSPLRLPVAGVHGLERRCAAGRLSEADISQAELEKIETALRRFAEGREGVLVERKAKAVALHYRMAPDAEAACRDIIDETVGQNADFAILRGKCVVEVRSRLADKGKAIECFMDEEPFAGRVPIFIGDDTTDEDGFRVVNARGGISVKVGEGETVARYHLGSPAEVVEWLSAFASGTANPGSSEGGD